ncbi:MAG: YhdH/YhfP family quinone oxidoreductase [Balneolaceae bacterium]
MRKSGTSYRALVAERVNGGFRQRVQELNREDLPVHDLLVQVHYSSLNYKDALSATGNPGVTRSYPHTPGIDAAGVVAESRDDRFQEGDKVIVTSYDLGQNTPGGFGEYISVPGEWVVPLPAGLTLEESMILGTAGFTAAYAVEKITRAGIPPAQGRVVVSGASGGVGSLSVAILSGLGYDVLAVTGKEEAHEWLRSAGASEIIGRQEVTAVSGKPLLHARWAAGVDTVGGPMLDAILRQTDHNGAVACCGNVLGGELETNIYPFILRGVGLMGVDSGICLMPDRKRIWNALAGEWKPDLQKLPVKSVEIDQLPAEIEHIKNGKQQGRVLVKHRVG